MTEQQFRKFKQSLQPLQLDIVRKNFQEKILFLNHSDVFQCHLFRNASKSFSNFTLEKLFSAKESSAELVQI